MERMAISVLKDLPFANTLSRLVDVDSVFPASCGGGRGAGVGCVAPMPSMEDWVGGGVLGRK